MNTDRLEFIFSLFSKSTILVVGDFFLDKYLILDHALDEISIETGLEARQVVEVRRSAGAAGTVTNNLRAMGVNVLALGAIGCDGNGYELKSALQATGVDTSAILEQPERFTPTYTKPMLREPDGSMRELNRLDIKNRVAQPGVLEDEIIARFRKIAPQVNAVIVADQVQERNCGLITDRVREEVSTLARACPNVFFAADSREHIGLFRDVIVKPNAREMTRVFFPDRVCELDRKAVEALGPKLFQANGRPVFLTLGPDGMVVFHAGGMDRVPALPVRGPIDIVGAGDSAMSGIIASLCAGCTPGEAAVVGNLAASVTIHQVGTTGVATRKQMLDVAKCFGLPG